MSVTERDFLALAQQIGFCTPLTRGEITARGAASRGYYAAFHATLAAYHDARPTPRINPSHEGWASWLRQSRLRELQTTGAVLEELRRLRIAADYDLADTPDQLEPIRKLRDVKDIVDRRAQICTAIRSDERAAPFSRHDRT